MLTQEVLIDVHFSWSFTNVSCRRVLPRAGKLKSKRTTYLQVSEYLDLFSQICDSLSDPLLMKAQLKVRMSMGYSSTKFETGIEM